MLTCELWEEEYYIWCMLDTDIRDSNETEDGDRPSITERRETHRDTRRAARPLEEQSPSVLRTPPGVAFGYYSPLGAEVKSLILSNSLIHCGNEFNKS